MTLRKLPTKMSAGFGLSMIDRAVKEFHAGRCSAQELRQVRDYFEKNGGLQCIYCGEAEASRWDRLHPVSRGGDTVPGNLVPACGSCDDSKQDREEWIQGTSPKRPSSEQSSRIHEEIGRFGRTFHTNPGRSRTSLRRRNGVLTSHFSASWLHCVRIFKVLAC